MQIKDYPWLDKITVAYSLGVNVYDEEFGIPFVFMLEKFIDEADMTDMEKVKVAKKLLKIINEG